MKKKLIAIALALAVLTGCSQKLDTKKQTFEDKGVSYAFQLPSTWEEDKNYQENYSATTVFAATDKKSNSAMFITTKQKSEVDLKDFAKKTQKQLGKVYKYDKAEDIYMKEFKVNKLPAYKYTVFTRFKEKKSWAHIYYIETENGFAQLIYYSADDNGYKKRAEIIDESARSLVETGQSDKVSTEEKEENTAKNDRLAIKVSGYKVIESESVGKLLAVKYGVTNLKETPLKPMIWSSLVTASYKGQELQQTTLPKESEKTELGELEKQSSKAIGENQNSESVVIYRLRDTNGSVMLHFSDEEFPEQEEIVLDLKALSK
ncbi:hypothetical protein A5821_002691 [Enterococcus sp. 7F3_DIV0205]|uniref:DUF5067 domain-containing protein n=1 Tax=Candidatus Enterococcus palustris TaxID=1834189 RepID=A0AAQ3Y7U1_9ENTE|nr:DUF5067 domain-containing protein [Enterococcus sp. 7F3_DIV0205]OTN83124.1 hypothetical protein A5821_003047 [Enterococcus sp. 7F3_DIV0205]